MNNPHIFAFQFELTSRCNEKCRHLLKHARKNDFSISILSSLTPLNDIINFDIQYMTLLYVNAEPEPLNPDEHICGAGIDFMCVSSLGEFYPCSGFQGWPLGNDHNQGVKEVWQDSEALKKLRAVKWRDFPKCMKCKAKPYCSMCMVRNLNETGSIFEVSQHFCGVAFINKRLVEEYKKSVK